MSDITFIDAPLVVSSENFAINCNNAANAKMAIINGWSNWLTAGIPAWPPAQLLNTDLRDLSNALVVDNQNNVPYKTCYRLMLSFTKPTGTGIRVLPEIKKASPRLKSIASELVAIAATIHAAQKLGLQFCGSRSEINSFFGSEVWQYRWLNEHGPDYLFTDTTGNVTFVEVKGQVLTLDFTPKDGELIEFADQKTQSINAILILPYGLPQPPIVRYVLSRVRRNPSNTITVRWFNHREIDRKNEGSCDAIVLATALSNYRQILRSVFGYHNIKLKAYEGRFASPRYATVGDYKYLMAKFGFIAMVPLDIANIFREIELHFKWLRDPKKDDSYFFLWNDTCRDLNQKMLALLDDYSWKKFKNYFPKETHSNLNWLPMGIVVREPQSDTPDDLA